MAEPEQEKRLISRSRSLRKLRSSIRNTVKARNRSNSDIGLYPYNITPKPPDSDMSLLEASCSINIVNTEESSNHLGVSELLARHMLALSCPAVTTLQVSLHETSVNNLQECANDHETADARNAVSLMHSRARGITPLVIEDPPSSEGSENDSNTVRVQRQNPSDPALLNGSSGNLSGSVGVRSAPSTPLGSSLQPPLRAGGDQTSGSGGGGSGNNNSSGGTGGVSGASVGGTAAGGGNASTPPANGAPLPPLASPIARSPSHTFAKYDKNSIKQLSCSAPTMTAQARSPEPPSPKAHKDKDKPDHGSGGKVKEKKPQGSSKGRQKKFHRHFQQVAADERVLNYYSCALVGDILLQGHLYITKNHFAFYSNVFGYITKLLIPTVSVLQISKEKTARIIPNAVGIVTENDKHVFGSLLSRESTYKFMTTVWKAAMSPKPEEEIIPLTKELIITEVEASECSIEDDSSCSQSGNDSPPGTDIAPRRHIVTTSKFSKVDEKIISEFIKPFPKSRKISSSSSSPIDRIIERIKENYLTISQLPRHTILMLITTILLLLLLISAGLLLYRIGRVQNKYSSGLQDSLMVVSKGDNVYNEILRWQAQLHAKSANEIHSFLSANLDQIAKVRQSLEALSMLIAPPSNQQSNNDEEDKIQQSNDNKQKTLASGESSQTNS